MSELHTCYDVLRVAPGSTREELRSAYRERARLLHPDRHVRPDGTVPESANEAFSELSTAFRTALAARTSPGSTVPAQRRVGPVAQPRTRRATSRSEDPLLALLTLPQSCPGEWSPQALTAWALTVVPAARAHLVSARCLAVAAGARSTDVVPAIGHALLTLTLKDQKTPAGLDGAHIASAYSTMEASLPAAVVAKLPDRVARAETFGGPFSAVALGVVAAVLALVVIYAAQITQLLG